MAGPAEDGEPRAGAEAVPPTAPLPRAVLASAPAEARELLELWFASETEARWFRPDPAFDRELAGRFGELVDRAAAGAFDTWLAEPWSALALVLSVDQLPRNIHRGTPRAFAYDAKAREVARAALARGHHRAVPARLRLFFYLPFEHSEDPADQARAVELCRELGGEALHYAEAHRAVIRRFGRFPHRNAILGRPSTAEEEAFLREPGSSF